MKRKISLLLSLIILFVTSFTIDFPKSFAEERYVQLGGEFIAMVFDVKGTIVDDIIEVDTLAGKANLSQYFNKGDIIIGIGDIEVNDSSDVLNYLDEYVGGEIKIIIYRDESRREITLVPLIDAYSGKRMLGLILRNFVSGIGTMTFVSDDGKFAALGHKVTDDTSVSAKLTLGELYNCKLLGFKQSSLSTIGHVNARISGNAAIGNIIKNNNYGVYGQLYNSYSSTDKVAIARANEVVPGKAKLVSSISGSKEFYDIEIIKAADQNRANVKGIVFRVTDKRLLNLTGGVLQGMSGSPILQKGKIVGGVTHVFVNDATKGYGVYAEWMLNNIA